MTGNNPHGTASNHHVLSVLVQNRPGVLARVHRCLHVADTTFSRSQLPRLSKKITVASLSS